VPTLEWHGDLDGCLRLVDQTRLPAACQSIECHTPEEVWEAIRMLRVRGAPAIGIAAAYGVCLGLRRVATLSESDCYAELDKINQLLASSRPTAVNLFWALSRMRATADELRGTVSIGELRSRLLAEAQAIHEEDRQQCRAIGRLGAALLDDGTGVLTHCNAGGLATSEYGTALAVLFTAHEQGKRLHVYVDETRPLLQGSRLTAWELTQRGIDATLICDSAAAHVMREGRVQAVIVGADRIAANGDTANKIGTYGLALSAAAHGVPFYVAAPTSTFDLSLASGDEIPIEERDAGEVTHLAGQALAPPGVKVFNPAFDVTPARYITAIVCERAIIEPVTRERIAAVVSGTVVPSASPPAASASANTTDALA